MHCDAILVYLISEKMDPEIRREWKLKSPGKNLQTLKELKSFLDATQNFPST